MMKKRGVGIAAGYYPTGMSGGGDTSQAYIKIKPDGSADLFVGSCDIGQGAKTVLAQIAAEELGIEYEQVKVINDNTDSCPICFGTFASRVTYVSGNAVVQAAREAKQMLFEVAASELEAPVDALEAADGKIFVKSAPSRCTTIANVAGNANFNLRKLIVGRGHFMRDRSMPDPETGACDFVATMAWTSQMAEVEVDTETGEVNVLQLIAAYDVGRAINPMLAEGQIEGGTVMGLGGALMENLLPYYPSLDWQPQTIGDYVIPTAVDVPQMQTEILECPSTDGPFGAKGIGEMTANMPSPAIVSAIHDAVGVWITELPVTPEKILRALDDKAKSPR
jgi:CO/xanthine dehydrogenase Mo-binding subunit